MMGMFGPKLLGRGQGGGGMFTGLAPGESVGFGSLVRHMVPLPTASVALAPVAAPALIPSTMPTPIAGGAIPIAQSDVTFMPQNPAQLAAKKLDDAKGMPMAYKIAGAIAVLLVLVFIFKK